MDLPLSSPPGDAAATAAARAEGVGEGLAVGMVEARAAGTTGIRSPRDPRLHVAEATRAGAGPLAA